jgi:hypothetical protein
MSDVATRLIAITRTRDRLRKSATKDVEPLGAHAIVTYANGSCASVQLDIQ